MSAHPLSPQPSAFSCGVCQGPLEWSPLLGVYWCVACEMPRSGPDDRGDAENDLKDNLQTLIDTFGKARVAEALAGLQETIYPESSGDDDEGDDDEGDDDEGDDDEGDDDEFVRC